MAASCESFTGGDQGEGCAWVHCLQVWSGGRAATTTTTCADNPTGHLRRTPTPNCRRVAGAGANRSGGRVVIATTLLNETRRWGVTLTRRGDNLVVAPGYKCPPELLLLLRTHKSKVLGLLEARELGLPVSSLASSKPSTRSEEHTSELQS